MPRVWLFVDEVGDSKFGDRNSQFFGLSAVATDDPKVLSAAMNQLLLERWSSDHVGEGWFHAQRDCLEIKQAVFALFPSLPLLRCDSVFLTKAKVYESLRYPRELYRAALRVLLRHVVPRLPPDTDELWVVAAKWDPVVPDLLPIYQDVLIRGGYHHPRNLWSRTLCCLQAPSSALHGLQVADYFGWAANRKITRNDESWLDQTRKPGRGVTAFQAF